MGLVGLVLLSGTVTYCAPRTSGQEAAITVFAASSLTESFTRLGEKYEEAHPGHTVRFSFGPSSGLAEQIRQGAPADVYAAASEQAMAQAADIAGPAQRFATNRLEIAVPIDGGAQVSGLEDLPRRDLKVVVCQPQVPCGMLASQVFAQAKITVRAVSQEADARAVLTKIRLGEADAGLVYHTDVKSASTSVRGIALAPGIKADTTYEIAPVRSSSHSDTADFIAFVQSTPGQLVLSQAGFGHP